MSTVPGIVSKCERCSGRMLLEIFTQPCEECKRTGASVCGSCWVHKEFNCINCGNTVYAKPVRRRELPSE